MTDSKRQHSTAAVRGARARTRKGGAASHTEATGERAELLPLLLPYPLPTSAKSATTVLLDSRGRRFLRLKLQLLIAEKACRPELSRQTRMGCLT